MTHDCKVTIDSKVSKILWDDNNLITELSALTSPFSLELPIDRITLTRQIIGFCKKYNISKYVVEIYTP
jgi:hypothetical protein